MRFDPSAYVESKRRQQKENQERFQRLRSPSYHGTGTHSRSSSLEKPVGLRSRSGSGGSLGRPPLGGLRAGSRSGESLRLFLAGLLSSIVSWVRPPSTVSLRPGAQPSHQWQREAQRITGH
ncbi:hypothetical protein GBAR_LOCUS31550 [Geodia barretti]|uniref:Uncharacterized protein n=1 Tax=Geodia barretti TaxID=519541 RepID=A0AA35U0N7_GEOBA|nr:hypothetical protein GBAR_LOCUS31550 [Geodia barretti]